MQQLTKRIFRKFRNNSSDIREIRKFHNGLPDRFHPISGCTGFINSNKPHNLLHLRGRTF